MKKYRDNGTTVRIQEPTLGKRMYFTDAELEVILSMIAIAGAGEGEGDYADWTDSDWEAVRTLRKKALAQ